MRLFISHASEDKAGFVEPLVAALKENYDVWFDKEELTLGDSLFGKINAGLSSCDFGVVVISPHYARKWPEAELDGLFALETTTRKVILPIWKDLTHAEVTKSYPMLAGRLGVYASAGIEEVVEAIRLAVDASSRQRELTGLQNASDRFKGLNETLTERHEGAILLATPEGSNGVRHEVNTVFLAIKAALSATSSAAGVLQFTFKRSDSVTFVAAGSFGLSLHLHVRRLADNSAASARFNVTVFKDGDFGSDRDFEIIQTREFVPSFRRGKRVVWKDENTNHTLSTEELGGFALDLFRAEIEKVSLQN